MARKWCRSKSLKKCADKFVKCDDDNGDDDAKVNKIAICKSVLILCDNPQSGLKYIVYFEENKKNTIWKKHNKKRTVF